MTEDLPKRERSAGSNFSFAGISKYSGSSRFSFGRDPDFELLIEPFETEESDKLDLDDEELEEYFKKGLKALNPQVRDIVAFSYVEREFVPVVDEYENGETVLLNLQGTCVNVDFPEESSQTEDESDEVEEESKAEGEEKEGEEGEGVGGEKVEEAVGEDEKVGEEVEEKEEGEGEEGEPHQEKPSAEGEILEVPRKPKKKLTNKFNFSERGALTYNNLIRDEFTQTLPPPSDRANDQANQWIIYDAYQLDYGVIQKEKERERLAKMIMQVKKEDHHRKKVEDSAAEEIINNRMIHSAKILERMINQNTYDEVYLDSQYYDDPADKYRKNEGKILPLWDFIYDETENIAVTDILWNPSYYDLFGVTFGSSDFRKPAATGYLCLFTLKNPSFPEYVGKMPYGIMCLDFHPRKSYNVACGLYDGSVAVFNVREKQNTPTHSTELHSKHGGVVWQVVWTDDPRERLLTFFSASSDGHIFKWGLLQTDLTKSPVISLFMEIAPIRAPDRTFLKLKAGATCITFHPVDQEIFLVGSLEGYIYKCSVAYASSFLFMYAAHNLSVHRISYNYFSPNIFISCSDDWRVKIWEDYRSEPLFVFDIEGSVGDVQWAPYSSTVFAAVSAEGSIHVYDLNLSKYDPVCIQAFVCPTQGIALTRFRFNAKIPILIAGDTRGIIFSGKLSPNCRIKPKPPKKQKNIDPNTLEVMKLDKVLLYVREPMVFVVPDDESEAS